MNVLDVLIENQNKKLKDLMIVDRRKEEGKMFKMDCNLFIIKYIRVVPTKSGI